MNIDNKTDKRLTELSRKIILSIVQTIVNALLILLVVKTYSLMIAGIVGVLSLGTILTWIYCVLEFLDVKKMLKKLNK